MKSRFYTTFSSSFDSFTIIWKGTGSNLQVERVFLSDPKLKSEEKVQECFEQIKIERSSSIDLVGNQIQRFLKGENVIFDLGLLDFNKCSETQKKVLLAEKDIPRGWVSTYKRIANHIGITNGARVVGNSLARNPFPIVIPCHRAIKTNGELGGFQGGIKMKRTLLEFEGIRFSERGKAITENYYY